MGSDADIVVWDAEATRVISAKTHHQVGVELQVACVTVHLYRQWISIYLRAWSVTVCLCMC